MTVEAIKTKLLSGSTLSGLDNTLADIIADLETLFQGTSYYREVLTTAAEAGVTNQLDLLSNYRTAPGKTWAQTCELIGLEIVTGEPQEFDLLDYHGLYHCAIYVDGEWKSKCNGCMTAERFNPVAGVHSMWRFANAV